MYATFLDIKLILGCIGCAILMGLLEVFSCTFRNGRSTEHTMFYVGFCLTSKGSPLHSTPAPGGKLATVHQRQPENDPDQPRRTERERWDHHTDWWRWWDRQSTWLTLYFRAVKCVCFHSSIHMLKFHYVFVDIDSSRRCSQSVSESYSVRRQNPTLLERTLWTQRNHHTVWGTLNYV